MNDEFFYGQGRISLAERDPSTGVPGKFIYLGDVSVLTGKMTTTQVKHIESNSGQRSLAASFTVEKAMTVDMTLHSLSTANLALAMRGAVVTTVGGTVTAEALPATVAVGDTVYLANPGVSALILTDSTPTTPKVLVEGTDYTVDENFGRIAILNVTTLVQPFHAAYTFAGRSAVGMFTTAQKYYALRYEGLDLANSNAPVLVDYFKVSPGVLQELQHITSGTDVAGMAITGDVLLDSNKPATGALGQFGSITKVAAAA
jgi:hypothetical protein